MLPSKVIMGWIFKKGRKKENLTHRRKHASSRLNIEECEHAALDTPHNEEAPQNHTIKAINKYDRGVLAGPAAATQAAHVPSHFTPLVISTWPATTGMAKERSKRMEMTAVNGAEEVCV